MVPSRTAISETVLPGVLPNTVTSSPSETFIPVTSTMQLSMQMRPTIGAGLPFTSTLQFPHPSRRSSPSAYPIGMVASRESRASFPLRPYPTVSDCASSFTCTMRVSSRLTGRSASPSVQLTP